MVDEAGLQFLESPQSALDLRSHATPPGRMAGVMMVCVAM
jgi:hypothetical protein